MPQNTVIVGAPKHHDLKKSLQSARLIRIAVAFATMNGWNHIREEIVAGGAVTEIVVGLNSWITEPRLLSAWMDLSCSRRKGFTVFVSPTEPMFHPKVFIITDHDETVSAIVGSGNLTPGGLWENIECGTFITDPQAIKELEVWFERLERRALNQRLISSYSAEFQSAKRFRAKKESSKNSVSRQLKRANREPAQINPKWDSDRFRTDFRLFMKSANATSELQERVDAARHIRQILHIPTFNISESDWRDFYRIRQFGTIRMAYPKIAEDIAKLQGTLRKLVIEPLQLETLDSALGGKLHIHGVGINLISKVLTAWKRERWPLFNGRVIEALAKYDYKATWGAEGYLQCAQDLRNCLSDEPITDFWALDVFCENVSR